MRRFLLLLFAIFLSITAFAQIEVKEGSFKEVPGFVNINPDDNYQTDDNNLPFAVVKVRTENINEKQRRELKFSGNGGTFIMLEYKDGEVWVYLTAKYADYLKISHPDLSSTEYTFPYDLKPKCGYEMTLVNKSPNIDKNNYLIIKVDQQNAKIFIDDELMGTGYASKVVSIGEEHRYKVSCDDYFPKEGLVYFDKREDKEISVVLEPNFGYITIKSDPSGAEIYVDEVKVGVTPYLMKKVKPGDHVVELRKAGYESYADMVTIQAREQNKQMENVVLVEDKNAVQQVSVTPVATSGSSKVTSTTTASGNKIITVNDVTFEMIAVNGGTFTMGATSEQGRDAYDNEKPAHSVTLSDYYIGKFEVTVGLFRIFIKETNYRTDADKEGWAWRWMKVDDKWQWEKVYGINWMCDQDGNVRNGSGDNHPVLYVSRNDAVEFCKWLSQKTGKTFRLPTEAEWEYAARGGNESRGYKYSGSKRINDVAWYGNISNAVTRATANGKTHIVGTKSPNELGIYDMSGNVWELCQDWYGTYNSISQTNPTGPSSGSSCVIRGGSWAQIFKACRVSTRDYCSSDNRSCNLGFRLVLAP